MLPLAFMLIAKTKTANFQGKNEDTTCKDDLLYQCNIDGKNATWKTNGTKCSDIITDLQNQGNIGTAVINDSNQICIGFFSDSAFSESGLANLGAMSPGQHKIASLKDPTTAVFSCYFLNPIYNRYYHNLCGYDPRTDFTLVNRKYHIYAVGNANCILVQEYF